MEPALALNLVAPPQTEGPATRLGYFHTFFLSCNILTFWPSCARECVHAGGSTHASARLLHGPEDAGRFPLVFPQTKNSSSVAFAMSPLSNGKDFKPLQLPQVVLLALHHTSLLAGVSVLHGQGLMCAFDWGSLFSSFSNTLFLLNCELSCPRATLG